MLPAEVNYSTTEQEILAIVFCFGRWRCYLEGSQVVLHTDHEPLTWVQNQIISKPNRRISRWLEILSRFHYEIVYIKGDENLIADTLTHMLSLPDNNDMQFPGEWPRTLTLYRLVCPYRNTSASPNECSDCSHAGNIPENSGGAKVRSCRRARDVRSADGSDQNCLTQSQARTGRGIGEHWVAAAGYIQARVSGASNLSNSTDASSWRVTRAGGQRGAGGEIPDKTDSEAPRIESGSSRRGKRGRGGETPRSKRNPRLDVVDRLVSHTPDFDRISDTVAISDVTMRERTNKAPDNTEN